MQVKVTDTLEQTLESKRETPLIWIISPLQISADLDQETRQTLIDPQKCYVVWFPEEGSFALCSKEEL